MKIKIKNKLGPLARLGRNQRYECHLGIPRLASGEGNLPRMDRKGPN